MPQDQSSDRRSSSWWTTLPGLLTATAALITAVTGLVIGLDQIGWLKQSDRLDPAATLRKVEPAAEEPGIGGAFESAGTWAVDVATGESFRSGEVEYVILGAEARPDIDGHVAVTFTVKCINHDRFDMNFWDASFRLLAGDDLIAPTSGLNVLVAADSSATGKVVFVVPDSTRDATLVVKFSEGERRVPVTLSPAWMMGSASWESSLAGSFEVDPLAVKSSVVIRADLHGNASELGHSRSCRGRLRRDGSSADDNHGERGLP